MQRRSFLKILGVGAAAPAVVAKPAQILTEDPLTGFAMNGVLLPDLGADEFSSITAKSNPLKRIWELKALISGEKKQEEEPYSKRQRFGLYEEGRLNGLRSVSLAHKHRMLHRRMHEFSHVEAKAYWFQELFKLENPDDK